MGSMFGPNQPPVEIAPRPQPGPPPFRPDFLDPVQHEAGGRVLHINKYDFATPDAAARLVGIFKDDFGAKGWYAKASPMAGGPTSVNVLQIWIVFAGPPEFEVNAGLLASYYDHDRFNPAQSYARMAAEQEIGRQRSAAEAKAKAK